MLTPTRGEVFAIRVAIREICSAAERCTGCAHLTSQLSTGRPHRALALRLRSSEGDVLHHRVTVGVTLTGNLQHREDINEGAPLVNAAPVRHAARRRPATVRSPRAARGCSPA